MPLHPDVDSIFTSAQRHGAGLLGRRQCRLKPMRCVAAVLNAVPLAPLPDRLPGRAVALHKDPGRFIARLDRSPDPRRGIA